MSVDEMLAALDRGEITDAKTVAALLLYARRRARAMIARRLIVRGRVQGVGYPLRDGRGRDGAGVAGWVRNRRDGTVEALVQGDADAVERLVAWCRRGPPAARVDGGDDVADAESRSPRVDASSSCADANSRSRRERPMLRLAAHPHAEDVLPRRVARRGPQRQREDQADAQGREAEPEQRERERAVDEERHRVAARRRSSSPRTRRRRHPSNSTWNGTNVTGSDARMPIA